MQTISTPAKADIPAQRALHPSGSEAPKTPPVDASAASVGPSLLVHRIVVASGACVALLGLLEMMAWWWYWTALLRIQSSYTPMQFNTALALIVTGGAVLLAGYQRTVAARVAGVVDLVLGTATLAETIFGWNLRIDQVFVHPFLVARGGHPGQLAPSTALCLLLIGAALLVWRPAMGRRRAAGLTGAASTVAGIAVIAQVGYLAGLPAAYTWAQKVPMALPTAIGMLITAVGLLALSRTARPGDAQPGAEAIAIPAGIAVFAVILLVWQAVVDTGSKSLDSGEASRAVLALAALAGLLLSLAAGLGQRAAQGRRLAEEMTRRLGAEGERRRAAEAAAEDIQRLTARFLEALPVAVLITAPGGHPYLVNQTARQLLGRGVVRDVDAGHLGEAYGTFTADTHEPYPAERSPSLRALAGETSHVEDVEVHRPDGDVIPIEAWGVPILDGEGHVQFSIAAFTDISQRRRDEQTLTERATLLDLASDAIYIRDTEHSITYWNSGAEALYGWDRAESNSRPSQLLLRTEFPAPFEDLEACLISDGYWAGQLVQYNKMGRRIDVDSRWSARYRPDGTLDSVLVINTDVTAKKAAERRVIERGAELARLNSELGRSNAELEQFAYIASHDLAEPLRAISGPVSLLARRYQGQLDPEADQFIAFAVDGCQRMQTLINDLLAFSRAGRVEGPPVAIDTNALLTHVLASLKPAIDARRAHITADDLPAVHGNPTQLAQLFQNLIANAVKFTPADTEPRIHISGVTANGQNTFTVTDNGIGIDARHRERIFGMFKRLHGRDEYPGTGIGLALCKKIVERHHGAIEAADGPDGIGSTFTVTLPAPSTAPEHTS